MTGRAWLSGALSILALVLALAPVLLAQDVVKADAAGGVADIAVQGYYLGGGSQPLSALSGMDISFREYLPAVGLLTGNLEGYVDSTRGRAGLNSVTLHGLRWKGRRWTITGGDYSFHTLLIPIPFTNYAYPEVRARGAKVEMTDGHRQYSFFAGEETLQEGPRITFRIAAPQFVSGATLVQRFGARLHVGVRYLGLSSSENQIEANPVFFPEGSTFRRTDSLTAQTSWSAGRGLTFFADTGISHAEFAANTLFPHGVPFSWLSGAQWKAKKITVTANYGSLSRSALPVTGSFFGDREGPFAEIRYKVAGSLELFGSALRSRNNPEKNPDLLNLSTEDLTAGLNVILPAQIGLSGQYSKVALTGIMPSDPTQNQSQHNGQAQLSLNKNIGDHSLLLTVRDLDLTSRSFAQKQRSAELQDDVHFSVFGLGGAVRMQQQSGAGQLQNSVFLRATGRLRLQHFLVYGQFEAGNDLIDKTLFATNSVKTTVLGVELPLNFRAARGWTLRVEAFRNTLISALNPANILVLQTQGSDVSDILNDFNQWSFYLRLSQRTHWGSPPPDVESANNQVVYGTIEGFVYEDGAASRGVPGVSVFLDKSRTATTDAAGHYRFGDVPEGRHAVALNTGELAAEYSPGPAPPDSTLVKPRTIARVDLRVVKAGSSLRGVVRGLAEDDRGVVRLENIVVNLVPEAGGKPGYTTCDGSGEFAFYNLTRGQYRVSVDRTTLPEDYVLVSEPELEVDPGAASDAPPIVFRIQKVVKELPVRRVLETSIQ